MKRIVMFFMVFQLIWTAVGMLQMYSYSLSSSTSFISCAFAQDGDDSEEGGGNPFLKWGGCFIGFAVIWIIFYWLMYPYLLKYYHPEYSKSLFWSMCWLYAIAWTSINCYIVFGIGFEPGYYWLKWVFAFIGAMWLVWLMIVLMRKEKAY